MPEPGYIALVGIPEFQRDTAVGDTRRIQVDVTDRAGALKEPEVLTLKIRDGEEETTTLELKDLTKVKDGRYYHDLDLDNAGTWAIRADAVEPDAAAEQTFYVPETAFA